MRSLVAIALVLAAAAAPLCAQRSGGRGGFSGGGSRSAPAFHSSSGFSSAPHFSRATPTFRMAAPSSNARYPSAYAGNRRPVGRPPVPFRGVGPNRGVGFYGYPGAIGYNYLDAPFYDDSTYDNSTPVPYADPGYGYDQNQPGPYQAYMQAPAAVVYAQRQPEPAPAAVTTLIFKDGRPAQKIQNYMVTRTTLTVIDGPRHHDIPVDDLDIPATVKANRESGVGFQLPAAR